MNNFRLLPSALALAFATVANAAVGDTFTENSCRYKVLTDSTVAFKGVDAGVTDVTVPAFVTNDGISYQVTEVADSAFFGNTDIRNVVVSEGVTRMGVRMFYNDTNLKSVSLPRSVTAIGRNLFYGCTSLESVDFLSRISDLPVSCFYECRSLREITLPNTIGSLGDYAFYGCTSLEMVYMADNVAVIPSDCFYDLPNLKEVVFSPNAKLKTINTRALNKLPSLERLSFPSSLTNFKYPTVSQNSTDGPIVFCPKLMEINIDNAIYKSFDGVVYSPDKTTLYFLPGGIETYTIDENTKTVAGYACVGGSLKTVNFPDNLETIGRFSFSCCTSLGNLVFPVNLVTIKRDAFYGCNNLGQLTFPAGCKLKTIEQWAFEEAGVSGELILPEGLETIGRFAFRPGMYAFGNYGKYGEGALTFSIKYGNLTKVVFPASLKRIEYQAFAACDMDSVILNDGLVFLGDGAFGCCHDLKYAYVPESVTQTDVPGQNGALGTGIFHRCENLVKVDWNAPILPQGVVSSCYSLPSFIIPETVTEIGKQAFSYCVSIRLI